MLWEEKRKQPASVATTRSAVIEAIRDGPPSKFDKAELRDKGKYQAQRQQRNGGDRCWWEGGTGEGEPVTVNVRGGGGCGVGKRQVDVKLQSCSKIWLAGFEGGSRSRIAMQLKERAGMRCRVGSLPIAQVEGWSVQCGGHIRRQLADNAAENAADNLSCVLVEEVNLRMTCLLVPFDAAETWASLVPFWYWNMAESGLYNSLNYEDQNALSHSYPVCRAWGEHLSSSSEAYYYINRISEAMSGIGGDRDTVELLETHSRL